MVLAFILFILFEVFGAKTRSVALVVLGFLFLYAFISVLCEEGGELNYILAFGLACLPVVLVVRAIREMRREERNEEEKETYDRVLNREERAYLRDNGHEAFVLKMIREGKCFMLGPGEYERAKTIGHIRWFEEQDEKREAMGEDKWFEEQKKLYDDGFCYTHRG